MVQVTIDSDDLEKVLYSTGAITTIESVIANFKKDPFFESAKAPLGAALTRINTAILNAKRAENNYGQWKEPSQFDFERMIEIRENRFSGKKMDDNTMKSLRSKGLIELGNTFHVTRWASSGEVSSEPLLGVMMRLSPRGEKLLDAEMARRESKFIDGDVLEYNARDMEQLPAPKNVSK